MHEPAQSASLDLCLCSRYHFVVFRNGETLINAFIQTCAALADRNRARILMLLRDGELCLCQVTELMQLASSTISEHLAQLRQAGLVASRKEGRWMHYRLATDGEAPVKAALRWAIQSLEADPQIIADAAHLRKILRLDLEVICRRQAKKRACCSSAPATLAAARWPKASPGRSKAMRSKPIRPASRQKA
jgi:DNA-binding transcriptional ArsR family regulator